MTKRALLIATVILALGASGLAGERPEIAAMKSTESWLSLVDQGKYGESWDAAAKLFRAALTRDKWKEAVGAARGPIGKLVSRTFKLAEYKTSLPGAPDGKYIVIQFDSSFASKKTAVETVTPMQEADGSWRVSGYFVK